MYVRSGTGALAVQRRPAKSGTRCARKERRIKCVKRNECRWEKEGPSGRSVLGAGGGGSWEGEKGRRRF